MRLINAVKADLRFQWKHGFFLIYIILTLLYLLVVNFLPEEILPVIVPVLIFSDPAILGLFFVGGILMLEQVQGVLLTLSVSPLRVWEFILSKIVSLTIVSVLSGVVLAAFTVGNSVNYLFLVVSIVLSSGFFTLFGVIIGSGCTNVNQYFVRMIPYMILMVIPCVSMFFPNVSKWLIWIPGVAGLKLMMNAFGSIYNFETIGLTFYLLVLDYFMFRLSIKVFETKMIYKEGL